MVRVGVLVGELTSRMSAMTAQFIATSVSPKKAKTWNKKKDVDARQLLLFCFASYGFRPISLEQHIDM